MDQDFDKLDVYYNFRRNATTMAAVSGFAVAFLSLFSLGVLIEMILMAVLSLSEPLEVFVYGFIALACSPYSLLGSVGGAVLCRYKLKRDPEIVERAEPGRWGLVQGLIGGIITGALSIIPALFLFRSIKQ
jgi:hypothetical protein